MPDFGSRFRGAISRSGASPIVFGEYRVAEIRHRLVNVGLRVTSLGSALILVLVMSATFPPSVVGIYGLFTATLSYFVLLVGLDFYTFSQRELAHAVLSNRWLILREHCIAAIFGYVLAIPMIGMVFSTETLPSDFLVVFLPLLLSEHLAQELQRVLVVLRRPLSASVVLFLRTGGWILPAIGLLILREPQLTLLHLLLMWLAGSLVAVMTAAILLNPLVDVDSVGPVSWRRLLRGLRTGLVFFVATLCFRLLLTADRYAFEWIAGTELLGAYVVFASIAMGIVNVLDPALFTFALPDILQAGRKSTWQLRRLVLRTAGQASLLCGLLTVVIVFLVPLGLQFSKEPIYLENLELLWLLLAAATIYGIGMAFHYGLYSQHGERHILLAHVLGVVIFVALVAGLRGSIATFAVPVAVLAALAWITLYKAIVFLAGSSCLKVHQ